MNQSGYHWELFTYATYLIRPKYKKSSKFLIYTIGRSGSTLLVNLINSNPYIQCYYELLAKKLISPMLYLRCRENLAITDVYGFKMNSYHFDVQGIKDPVSFVRELVQSGYKIIHLKRCNLLRQVISHIYALERNKFHHTDKQGEQKHEKILISLDVLQQDIKDFENYQLLETMIIETFPHLELIYEDDLLIPNRHQDTIDRITQYLGVPSIPVHSDYVKTTPKELRQIIINFEEVKDYLDNTKYYQFLEES